MKTNIIQYLNFVITKLAADVKKYAKSLISLLFFLLKLWNDNDFFYLFS